MTDAALILHLQDRSLKSENGVREAVFPEIQVDSPSFVDELYVLRQSDADRPSHTCSIPFWPHEHRSCHGPV